MIIRTPAELGATIKDRRRQLRLGQQQLAEKVGVSRQWLIEVERGKSGAEIGLVFRTLAALGITLRADAGDTPPAPKKPAAGTVDLDAIIAKARRIRK
jgi:HTH-type transcriptional regulator/antitoxin HipB